MNLIKDKPRTFFSKMKDQQAVFSEITEGLCMNCDHRNLCVWKENKKIYCELFN